MGRYVIYGAGGVGGVLGGSLFQAGADVALIARGEHRAAIAARGLRVDSPESSVTLSIPVAERPEELAIGDDDVVVLTMKTQDTLGALEALAAAAPASVPVLCAQNGVANEAMALRFFEHVYGVCVVCATTYLAPGVVMTHAAPRRGHLDLGRYPQGTGDRAAELAGVLTAASWPTTVRDDVMTWKFTKLLRNLGNVVHALCGPEVREGEIFDRLAAEGRAVLQAAGIDTVSGEEWNADGRQSLVRFLPIEGFEQVAGSTWQSVVRGTGSIETDYLNGEIVLLGRLNGVPTPANELVCLLGDELARSRSGVGARSEAELLAML